MRIMGRNWRERHPAVSFPPTLASLIQSGGGGEKPMAPRRRDMTPEEQDAARAYARAYYRLNLETIRSQQRASYARKVGRPVRPSSNMRGPSPPVPLEEGTLP